MKITDKQLEELLLKSFDHLDKLKEVCKIAISQCMHSSDLNKANNLIRACMETMDTSDLCRFFIINKSPNTKYCVSFTLKVLNTCDNECKKLFDDESCKDMAKFCHKLIGETYPILKKLHDSI